MIIAANLKCNHTRASFARYAAGLGGYLAELGAAGVNLNAATASADLGGALKGGVEFTASEMAIRTMASLVQDKGATSGADSAASKFNSLNVIVAAPAACFCKVSGFELAAQNFYPAANGSFTGETGAEMLAEWGIKSVIVGHSERRMLGESEEFLRSKFDFAAKRGWRVIYCIGESLSEYESGASAEVLGALASNIDLRYSNLILAYEPIFSIGTGVSASVEHIGKMLSHLHTLTPAPLLYGGSVSAKNVSEIVGVANCDGVLVGTASWELEGFKALIEAGLKI